MPVMASSSTCRVTWSAFSDRQAPSAVDSLVVGSGLALRFIAAGGAMERWAVPRVNRRLAVLLDQQRFVELAAHPRGGLAVLVEHGAGGFAGRAGEFAAGGAERQAGDGEAKGLGLLSQQFLDLIGVQVAGVEIG